MPRLPTPAGSPRPETRTLRSCQLSKANRPPQDNSDPIRTTKQDCNPSPAYQHVFRSGPETRNLRQAAPQKFTPALIPCPKSLFAIATHSHFVAVISPRETQTLKASRPHLTVTENPSPPRPHHTRNSTARPLNRHEMNIRNVLNPGQSQRRHDPASTTEPGPDPLETQRKHPPLRLNPVTKDAGTANTEPRPDKRRPQPLIRHPGAQGPAS